MHRTNPGLDSKLWIETPVLIPWRKPLLSRATKPLKPGGLFSLFDHCRELWPNIHDRLKHDPPDAEK